MNQAPQTIFANQQQQQIHGMIHNQMGQQQNNQPMNEIQNNMAFV